MKANMNNQLQMKSVDTFADRISDWAEQQWMAEKKNAKYSIEIDKMCAE